MTTRTLQGRHILVTGAARGIGQTMAIAFAEHGAHVHLLGRSLDSLNDTHAHISSLNTPPAQCWALNLNSTSTEPYQAFAQALYSHLQEQRASLSGVLHNAGLLGEINTIEAQSWSHWQSVMQVNVNAAFLLTQQLLPLLRQARAANLVFTSSSVGQQGRANWGAYSVSKFATEGLMQVLACELADSRIRVCAINPGGTRTDMRAQAIPTEEPNHVPTAESLIPAYIHTMSEQSNLHGQCLVARRWLQERT